MSASQRHLRKRVGEVASRLEQLMGRPSKPAHRTEPLDVLIATILSQHTNDRNSHAAYSRLRAKYRTWGEILNTPTRSIRTAIRVGGLGAQKAARIKQIVSAIEDRFGSADLRALRRMTDAEAFDLLVSLNGVGLKTAACVLLFSLGRDCFPVDTHIHRVCVRLGLAPRSKSPDETFVRMRDIIPDGKAYSLHLNLIQFGRSVCRANNPRCGVCPLYDICPSVEKQQRAKASATASLSRHVKQDLPQ